MRIVFSLFLLCHGAIHLLGFLKRESSWPRRLLWLVATLLFVSSALLWLIEAPYAPWPTLAAVVLSTALISTVFREAKVGLLANIVALVPVLVSALDLRDSSFASIYRHEVEAGLGNAAALTILDEADIAHLPPAVQQYLRRTNAIGAPRVHNFHARFKGEMKLSRDADWTEIRAEQQSFLDPPSRIFLMSASRLGAPFEGLHLFTHGEASMQVRVGSIFQVVDARGPKMDQSETVTFFNDMCLLAPAMLADADIRWEELGARSVRGRFGGPGHQISAVLFFDENGDLERFVSEDRYQSADGETYVLYPWITPVRDYRAYGTARLAEHGEAIWREPSGAFTYARFRLLDVEYNVGRSAKETPTAVVTRK